MASTVVVLPECRLPTTAIIGVGGFGGIFLRLCLVWVFMDDCGSGVKLFWSISMSAEKNFCSESSTFLVAV